MHTASCGSALACQPWQFVCSGSVIVGKVRLKQCWWHAQRVCGGSTCL